jgi:MFS family permease
MVMPQHRGKAYGIYNSAVGVTTLPASFLAGLLWDKINPSAPFLFGAAISIISFFALFIFMQLRGKINA